MKFIAMTLRQGMFKKSFNFSDGVNLIYSEENSKGKTSLLRFLLLGLGYSIPQTKGLNLNKFEITLHLSTSNKEYKLVRNRHTITLHSSGEETIFSLPIEHNQLLSVLLNNQNEDVLNNLLGAFYFDQEKGWTLLNRGVVIGKVKFDIAALIRGLAGRDAKDLIEQRFHIEQQIKKYKTMFDLAEYKKQIQQNTLSPAGVTYNDELSIRLNGLLYEKNKLEKELAQINEIIKQNSSLINYLEKNRITVQNSDGITIPVTRDTVRSYADAKDFSIAKKQVKLTELAKVNGLIHGIRDQQKTNDTLVSVKTLIELFDEDILKIDVNSASVSNVIKQLHKKKNDITNIITQSTKHNNQIVTDIYTKVFEYATELGLTHIINQREDYIFTDDLKGLSGAILHKLVFAFKMAYLKVIEQTICIKLPIILDSPKGREVDKQNIDAMLNILKREFVGYQIIMASIFDDYTIQIDSTIKIQNLLMADAEFVTEV